MSYLTPDLQIGSQHIDYEQIIGVVGAAARLSVIALSDEARHVETSAKVTISTGDAQVTYILFSGTVEASQDIGNGMARIDVTGIDKKLRDPLQKGIVSKSAKMSDLLSSILRQIGVPSSQVKNQDVLSGVDGFSPFVSPVGSTGYQVLKDYVDLCSYSSGSKISFGIDVDDKLTFYADDQAQNLSLSSPIPGHAIPLTHSFSLDYVDFPLSIGKSASCNKLSLGPIRTFYFSAAPKESTRYYVFC